MLCLIGGVRLYCMSSKEASDQYVAGNKLYHDSANYNSQTMRNAGTPMTQTMRSGQFGTGPMANNSHNSNNNSGNFGGNTLSPGAVPPFGGIDGGTSYGSIMMVPDGASTTVGRSVRCGPLVSRRAGL